MTSKNNQPGDAAPSADTTGSLQADSLRLSSGQALRRQAEAKLSERKKKAAALPVPETDTQRLIHELEVHQIELEMQNEELVQSRTQVEVGLRQYTDLYDFAPVGYFTLAHDGAIHQVNLAGANLLGAERGALIKRRFGVFVSARSRTTFSAFLEKVFSTSGSKETCEIALQKDGSAPLWVHIKAMTEDGQRKTCRAVVVDITERKRVEEAALQESEESYRNLFENAGEAILVIQAGKLVFLNPMTAMLTGYSAEELMSRPFIEFVHPDNRDMVIDRHVRRMKGEELPHLYSFRIINRDGNIKWVEQNAVLINWKGKAASLNFLNDITLRKRAEEELMNSESKYRNIFENAMEGIFQSALEGRFITLNAAFARMAGYDSPEELIGSIEDIGAQFYVHPEDRNRFSEIMATRGFVDGFEVEFYKKDGSTFWAVINSRAVKDEQGEILYFEGIVEDVTLRKHAEEQLRKTLENLRKAFSTTVQVLVSAVETRDPYTSGHQIRSADLARAIATEMGLPQERIDGIRMAGSIHDIGKMSVPAEILVRPTKLTELEFSLIKEHANKGFEMLKDVESPWPLAEIVYQHHERMDGSGYPRGLKGDEIIMEARILAVADVVESMASHRPYRPALGSNAALAEIENNKGTLYDADVVDACLRLFREKGFQLEGTRL